MNLSKRILILFCGVIQIFMLSHFSAGAANPLKLPGLISDNMLIQQGKPIKLWGNGGSGQVTAKIMDDSKIIAQGTAVVQNNSWSMELPSLLAGGPYMMTFSSGVEEIAVSNVLIGELWVTGGQSNMAMKVSALKGAYKNDILPSAVMDKIRLFIPTGDVSSSTKETDISGSWVVADPETAKQFSAVGYAALSEMYNQLQLPVGGLYTAVSGAMMYQLKGGDSSGVYYNKMVHPMSYMNVAGVLWYQGESDRGGINLTNYTNFRDTFNDLISTWRSAWNDNLPFIFVQLPSSPMTVSGGTVYDFSIARLGQLASYYTIENTGMAVSLDCQPNTAVGDDPLHPSDKFKIGQRLAYSAMALHYGRKTAFSGPMFQNYEIKNNKILLTFSNVEDGLQTTDGGTPRCFMIAGDDGVFYEGTGEIIGSNQLLLSSPHVASPKKVHYCIDNEFIPTTSSNVYSSVNLVNSAKLPASPFITDTIIMPYEVKPKITVPELTYTALVGEMFSMPGTIQVINQSGGIERKSVAWKDVVIDTATVGSTRLFGLVKDTGCIAYATVNVVEDTGAKRAKVEITDSARAQITISGKVSDGSAGQHVNILALNPGVSIEDAKTDITKLQYQGSVDSQIGGSYEHTFTLNLPNDFVDGDLMVYVGGDDFDTPETHIVYYASFEKVIKIAKEICNSEKTVSELASLMNTYQKALSINTVLFVNADKNFIAENLKKSLYAENINFSNEAAAVSDLQNRIKQFALLDCFRLNRKDLIFNGTNYLWENVIPLYDIDINGITVCHIYTNSINQNAKINVTNGLFGQSYATPEDLRKCFAKMIILQGIKNNISEGYGFVSNILTRANAEFASVSIPKYLKLSNQSNANIGIVKAKSSLTVGNMETVIESAAEISSSSPMVGKTSSKGSGGGNVALAAAVPIDVVQIDSVPVFSDLETVPWAKTAIEFLSEKQMIVGDGSKLYYPDNFITREQVAKMICMAFHLAEGKRNATFDDVNTDEWYSPYVDAVIQQGIMNGYNKATFGVGDYVTREDFAAVMFRSVKPTEDSGTPDFTDVNTISDYAKESVAYMQRKNIVSGYEDGSFRPKGYVTRAEAAKVIYELIKED